MLFVEYLNTKTYFLELIFLPSAKYIVGKIICRKLTVTE